MATFHTLHLHHLVIFIFLTIPNPSFSVTELVSKICKQTPNYTYCVQALYSDPHTPTADENFLAYISFHLAYANATNTRDHISHQLSSAKSANDTTLVDILNVCTGHYDKAIDASGDALEDLYDDTFSELVKYANATSREADHCEGAFRGTRYSGLLTVRNSDLKRLSQICYVVSQLID